MNIYIYTSLWLVYILSIYSMHNSNEMDVIAEEISGCNNF
jgi:hypothetical protein